MSGPLKEGVFQKEDQTRLLSYPYWMIYESCMLLTSIHLHGNEQWDKAPNYFFSHPLQLALLSMGLLAEMGLFYRKAPCCTTLPAVNAWWGYNAAGYPVALIDLHPSFLMLMK